jgi:hypothetical protein
MGPNIEDLTIGEARKLAELFYPKSGVVDDAHWKIGKCYLIRTVTMIQTGRLVKVTEKELVLEDAAWVADTGRFSEALVSLNFSEVEPFPDGHVIVGRGAIVDAVQVARVQREVK